MPVNTMRSGRQRNKPNNQGRGGRGPGRGNIHQNVDNIKANQLHGVYTNPRFCDTIARLKGCRVNIQVKSGGVYDGVLSTISPKGDIVLNETHRTDQTNVPGGIVGKLVLKPVDIVTLSAKNVDMDYPTKGLETFAIDSEIGGRVNGQIMEKKLEQWVADGDDNDAGDIILEDELSLSMTGNGWTAEEMFETNRAKFGYRSSFKENLEDYTTPLNEEDTPEYRERKRRADKLAREIEQSPDHISRENLENNEEVTEEDKFSAVVRPGSLSNNRHSMPNSSNTDRYIPPHQRQGGGNNFINRHANRKNPPSGMIPPSGSGRSGVQDRQMQSQPSRQVPQSHHSSQSSHPHHANQSKNMPSQQLHHSQNSAISQHRVPSHSQSQPHTGMQQNPGSHPQSQSSQQHPTQQHPSSHPVPHGHSGVPSQSGPQVHHHAAHQGSHHQHQHPPQSHPGMVPHSPTSHYTQPVRHHQPPHHMQPQVQQQLQQQQQQSQQSLPGPHIQKQPQSPSFNQAPQIHRHPSVEGVPNSHNSVTHSSTLSGRQPDQPESRLSYPDNRQHEAPEVTSQRKEVPPPHASQRSDVGPRSPISNQSISPAVDTLERHQAKSHQKDIENLKQFSENFKLPDSKKSKPPQENKVPIPTSQAAAPVVLAEKPATDTPSAAAIQTAAPTEPATSKPTATPYAAITEKNETEEAEKSDGMADKGGEKKSQTLNPDAPVFVPNQIRKPSSQKTPTPPPSRSPQQNIPVYNPTHQQQFVMYQSHQNPYVVHAAPTNMQPPQPVVRAARTQKQTVSNIPGRFSNEYPGHYSASMAGTPLISPMALQPNQIITVTASQQGAGQGHNIGGPFTHQVMPGQVIQQVPYMYKQSQVYRQVHPGSNHGTTTALQAQHQQLVPGSDNSAMLNAQAIAYQQQTMVQHQQQSSSQNPYSHPSAQLNSAQQMQHQPHPHAQQHTTPPLSQTQAHQAQAPQVMGPQGQFTQHGGRPSPGPVPQQVHQVHHVQQQGGLHHQVMVNAAPLVYTQQLQQPPQPGQQAQHSGQQYNIHPASIAQHPHMAQQSVQVNPTSHVPSNINNNITSVTPVHSNPHPHPQPANVVYVNSPGQHQGTIPQQQMAHPGSHQIIGPFIQNPAHQFPPGN